MDGFRSAPAVAMTAMPAWSSVVLAQRLRAEREHDPRTLISGVGHLHDGGDELEKHGLMHRDRRRVPDVAEATAHP
ncbi:hypothetical protein [Paraburkholderia caballeronis]|uniref:hypothetical protein n=1 Tax=Paraburkholderia caballeronis TaxID=416943 RepID=UPI0014170105|nr:hypothetical protein [Paraburkholderia caballeronis]